MPRVSIWLPDELHRAAKELRLPLSELAQGAVRAEVERHRKAALLGEYLHELDAELGPATEEQSAEADRWAAKLTSPARQRRKPKSA
jgi:hypothetical protein